MENFLEKSTKSKKQKRLSNKLRMKSKVVSVLKGWGLEVTDKQVGLHLNHGLALCSCYMCGNPRNQKVFKYTPTANERRKDEDYKEQLKEL